MDWFGKAMLTAATVAALLVVGRLFDRRLAGILAGLPTVTGPALIWLALDHSASYAIEAATGSIVGCGLCAAFAVVYDRASRHCGIVTALTLAIGLTVPLALPLHSVSSSVGVALTLAAAVCVAAYAAIPPAANEITPTPRLRGEVALTAVVAGAVSGLAMLFAPTVGPFWAGVIASPPLIAAAVAAHQHAFGSMAGVRRFLRGYVAGLQGRAVFAAGFALLLDPAGIIAAALLASMAGGVFTRVSLHGLDRAEAMLAEARRGITAPPG